MNQVQKRKEKYRKSIERAVKWMVSHQKPDGSFGDVISMSHYMALPSALLYLGEAESAQRLIPYLRKVYVNEDGSINWPPPDADDRYLAEEQYFSAWMIFSAHANLAFDISLGAMPHLFKYQHAETGGVFGRTKHAEAGKGILHVLVTTSVGQAALATGYIAEARRMGDFIVDRLIPENPDLGKAFYPVYDTERGVRTDEEAPPAPNMPRVLLRNEPNQHHFVTGFMVAYLSDLYAVTGERKYLDGAIIMHDFADGGTQEMYQSTGSHKFCWGCAWLYRQTGDPRHLESACKMADGLIDNAQDPDGSFVHYAFVKSSSDFGYSPRLNITGQFALWIQRALNVL
jgi:hypothetical protein